MNEQILRDLWDADFEESNDFRKAKLAALTAKMQRDAAYRTALRQAPFDATKRANAFRTNFANQGQSKEEIALAALQRFHDDEVSGYIADRTDAQAQAFMDPQGFPYIERAEPDFTFDAPWMRSGRAMASASNDPRYAAARAVELERYRSVGSADPFTAEDEIVAAQRIGTMRPQWAVAEVADRGRREELAAEQAKQDAITYAQSQKMRKTRTAPRLPDLTEDSELASMLSASRGGRLPVTVRNGWDSEGELAELEAMRSAGASADEFARPAVLNPVGARPVTPIGAQSTTTQRATLMPVAPWRIPNWPSW